MKSIPIPSEIKCHDFSCRNSARRRLVRASAVTLLMAACVTLPLGAVDATFQFFRFTPTKLRNDATANSVQLAEFQYKHQGTVIFAVDVTNPEGNNPAAETPPLANDDDLLTKWLDFNKGPLVYDMGAQVTIDSYAFATANDAIERDPVSWKIEGSNDGTDWTVLDQFTDFATPTERRRLHLGFPAAVHSSSGHHFIRTGGSHRHPRAVDHALVGNGERDRGVDQPGDRHCRSQRVANDHPHGNHHLHADRQQPGRHVDRADDSHRRPFRSANISILPVFPNRPAHGRGKQHSTRRVRVA